MEKNYASKPKKWKKIIKILLSLVVLLIIAVIILYNYLTSASFIKGHIIPKVEKDINRTITIDTLKLKPFSLINVGKFSITNPNKKDEPALLSFSQFELQYSLFSIIKGNPSVKILELIEPQINVIVYPDGTTNLDDLTKGEKKEKPKKEKSEELPNFYIGSVTIKNGKITYTQYGKNNQKIKEIKLTNVNYTLTEFSPEVEAKSKFGLNIAILDKIAETDIKNGALNFDTSLMIDRKMSRAKITSDFTIKELAGKIQGQNAGDYSLTAKLNLNKDNSKLVLDPFEFVFKRRSETGGKVSLTGNYDDTTGSGEFLFKVDNINNVMLNVIPVGENKIDFRDTQINQTTKIKLSEKGKNIIAEGEILINNFSVLISNISNNPTKAVDLSLKEMINYNSEKQTVKIDYFDINASQSGSNIIKGSLTQPLLLDLNKMQQKNSATPAISYNLTVDSLDLTQIQPMLPLSKDTFLNSAMLNTNMNFIFENSGAKIQLKGDAGLTNLSGQAANIPIPYSDIQTKIDTTILNFADVKISEANLALSNRQQQTSFVNLNGDYSTQKGDASFNIELKDFLLSGIQSFLPADSIIIQKGELNCDVALKGAKNFADVSVNGDVNLASFSAKLGDKDIKDFSITAKIDQSVKNFSEVDIREMFVDLSSSNKKSGNVDIKGKINASGDGNIKINSKINQTLLESFASFLPPNFNINTMDFAYKGDISVKNNYNDITAKSTFDLKNLRGNINQNTITDLNIEGDVDKTVKNFSDAEIRNCIIKITSKNSPAGNVSLKGKVNTNEGSGDIQLEVSNISESSLALFAGYLPEGIKIKSINLNYSTNMNLKKNFTEGSIKGNLNVKNLFLEDAKTQNPIIPKMDIALKHDINMGNPKIDLKDIQLDLTADKKQTETIKMNGEIIMDSDKINCKMNVNSNFITADNYLVEAPKSETDKKAEPATKQEEQELEAMNLDYLTFVGNTDIKNLTYKSMKITDLLMESTLQNSIFDIKKLTMKINGSDFSSTINSNLNVPGWTYKVNSSMNKLDLYPVLESFAPDKKDKISGKATLNMDINGQGITQPNLEKNLKGTIKGDIADGKISSLSILNALADLIKIQELKTLSFFKSDVDIAIDNGKINMNKLDFVGELEKLGIRGWVGLDKQQTIDLSLYLALAPPLSNELKKIDYLSSVLETDGNYTAIPIPIGMAGTSEKPKASLNISKTTQETGKKVIKKLLLDELDKQLKKDDKKK